jgi:hypothetical protein
MEAVSGKQINVYYSLVFTYLIEFNIILFVYILISNLMIYINIYLIIH